MTRGFDYSSADIPAISSARPKLLGLSDPLSAPTGFGRVARELFLRLSKTGRYDLAYLSRGWVGSSRFPGVSCYSDGNRPGFCQEALPAAAVDFAGVGKPFILWTLLDPWQVGWLALPETSPQRRPVSIEFLKAYREKICWIGHFPIDGMGPRNGPARWTEQFIGPMDIPVAMSEWGRQMIQPLVEKDVRFISHAIDTTMFHANETREKARAQVESSYALGVAKGLGSLPQAEQPNTPAAFAAEVQLRTFQMRDHFVVLCVMANRPRKYWWEVLLAFRKLLEDVPGARLIGVCGDRMGRVEDSWPLEDCCRDLGFRLDREADDPNVWLIETVTGNDAMPEDASLRLLYRCADVSVLLSGGEGFGLPQLEAHACGIPCIAGDYSSSTELAVHSRELIGPRGFTFSTVNMVKRPVYSPKDLADRLAFAARNPVWRKEIGAGGVEQARARDWAQILPQWVSVFDEAADRLGVSVVNAEEGTPDASPVLPQAAPT